MNKKKDSWKYVRIALAIILFAYVLHISLENQHLKKIVKSFETERQALLERNQELNNYIDFITENRTIYVCYEINKITDRYWNAKNNIYIEGVYSIENRTLIDCRTQEWEWELQ